MSDIAHVVLDGHTFHDEGHESPDHCCSGAFHFCSCHATAPAITVAVSCLQVSVVASRESTRSRAYVTGAPTDAHLFEMFRPPAA